MILLLKNLLFTFVVPGTVAVYVPLLLAGDQPHTTGSLWVVAVALFGVGVSIYIWCVWDFATFGQGTPAPIDAPKSLVVRGLYHYSRTPMYVAVLTTILGWAVLLRAPSLLLYLLCVGLCFHSFVVLYEEPHLQQVFGDSYAEYRAHVGRWLPSIRRSRADQRSS